MALKSVYIGCKKCKGRLRIWKEGRKCKNTCFCGNIHLVFAYDIMDNRIAAGYSSLGGSYVEQLQDPMEPLQ